MIIKNGEVFQEDGSFRLQDLYVENHRKSWLQRMRLRTRRL